MVARGGGWLPSSSSASLKRTPSCFSAVASCLSGKRRATTEGMQIAPGGDVASTNEGVKQDLWLPPSSASSSGSRAPTDTSRGWLPAVSVSSSVPSLVDGEERLQDPPVEDMVIASPGGGKRLDPPVEDMMIAPPGPVHTGSLVKDLQAMGIGQDQVWALSSAASKTMSGPCRSQQLLAAKRHFTVLNGFGNHGHELRRVDLRRKSVKHGAQAQWGCRVCLCTWRTFGKLREHLESLSVCEGEGTRVANLASLSWREKWQWATPLERRIFRDSLGLTKAEALKLSRNLVWKEPPRGFLHGSPKHGTSARGRSRHCKAREGPSSMTPRASHKRRKRAKKDEAQCEWPCSVCSATFVSDDKVKLSRMRDNHINRVHGELPRSLFPTLNGQMGSERPAGSKGGKKDRQGRWLWQCDVCQTTFRHKELVPLRGLRFHHIKVEHPGLCGSCFTTVNGNQGRQTLFDQGELRQLLEDPSKVKRFKDRRRAETLKDGDIESNPGPDSSSCSRAFTVFAANVNGYSNAYDAIDMATSSRPHVLALQEVRTPEASACKLVQHCSRLGYRAWTVSR